MDVLTVYVGQGSLVGVRIADEGVIIDAHMPERNDVTPNEVKNILDVYFRGVRVRGLMLTGFDADHAHAEGVDWMLARHAPDWIMYPKYFKDTDTAASVFRSIDAHERRRTHSARPLTRHSIRVDRLENRTIGGLGKNFSVELFSPHVEDMDSSNNCSIVAKITGTGRNGFRYLATGDTETERWAVIDSLFGGALSADVMAAPHHGALSGVHPASLLSIRPNTVLVSAGADSQYDHPHPAAIRTYGAVAEHVLATNAGGGACNLLTRREGDDFRTVVFRHSLATAA